MASQQPGTALRAGPGGARGTARPLPAPRGAAQRQLRAVAVGPGAQQGPPPLTRLGTRQWETGLRNASSCPARCASVFILKVTVKQRPHYGDISRIAATGLPPALCFSGRGQQQEIKTCFYVASKLCQLNEPTNPAVTECVLLTLLST